MPDTPQTQAQLIAAYADNVLGNITEQVGRNLIVSGPIGTDKWANAAPALTFGTTNVDGAAASYVRTDDTIALFDDSIAPNTVSPAIPTSSAGSNTVAARRNHVHGFAVATAFKRLFGDMSGMSNTNLVDVQDAFADLLKIDAVGTSDTWWFEFNVFFSSAAGGIKFGLAGPANTTTLSFWGVATDGTNTQVARTIDATYATAISFPNVTGDPAFARLQGIVQFGNTSGVFKLQAAQAAASGTTTIRVDSNIQKWRLT